jgi:Smg protein
MDERLSSLLARLRERFPTDARPDEVEAFLRSEGYDGRQIGEILDLLNGAGMLSASELEHVIDRALTHIDGRIALDDLRSLMEGTGFDESGPPTEQVTIH